MISGNSKKGKIYPPKNFISSWKIREEQQGHIHIVTWFWLNHEKKSLIFWEKITKVFFFPHLLGMKQKNVQYKGIYEDSHLD